MMRESAKSGTGFGGMCSIPARWLAVNVVAIAICGTVAAQDDGSRPPDLIPLPKFSPSRLPDKSERFPSPNLAPDWLFEGAKGGKPPRVDLDPTKLPSRSGSDYFHSPRPSSTADELLIPIRFESPEQVAGDVNNRTQHALDKERQLLLDLDREIRLHPERAELYYQRGISRVVLSWRGDTEALAAAWTDLCEAMKRDPGNADFRFARGWIATKLGDTNTVLSELSHGLYSRPENPWALNLRGQINKERHRYDKALADFNRAIAIDPGYGRSVDLLKARSACFAAHGFYRRAVWDLDAAMAGHSFDSYAYLRRARYFGRLGEKQRARADVCELIQIRPDDPGFRVECNLTLIGLGEYTRAYRDADQLVRKYPDQGVPYLLRFDAAYLAARRRDYLLNQVEQLARSAERLLPVRPLPAMVRVACVALTASGRELALRDMEHGLDRIADFSLPHALAAVIYTREGRFVPTCRHLVIFAMRFHLRQFEFDLTLNHPGFSLWFQEYPLDDETPTKAERAAEKPIAEETRDIILTALASEASPRW